MTHCAVSLSPFRNFWRNLSLWKIITFGKRQVDSPCAQQQNISPRPTTRCKDAAFSICCRVCRCGTLKTARGSAPRTSSTNFLRRGASTNLTFWWVHAQVLSARDATRYASPRVPSKPQQWIPSVAAILRFTLATEISSFNLSC